MPEPEHSSPVLTWILGYFWSLPKGVSPRLELGHARALSSRARKRKRGSSGCGRDYRASSRVETGMLGIFLSCSKCVKDLWNFQILGVISLETPQQKWASSRLEGRTSWIFSTWGSCSRLTMGTSGTRSGGLRKGQPHASCSGASRDSSPVDAGALNLVWSQCCNLSIPFQC